MGDYKKEQKKEEGERLGKEKQSEGASPLSLLKSLFGTKEKEKEDVEDVKIPPPTTNPNSSLIPLALRFLEKPKKLSTGELTTLRKGLLPIKEKKQESDADGQSAGLVAALLKVHPGKNNKRSAETDHNPPTDAPKTTTPSKNENKEEEEPDDSLTTALSELKFSPFKSETEVSLDLFYRAVRLREVYSLALQSVKNPLSVGKDASNILKEGSAQIESSEEHGILMTALSKADLPFFRGSEHEKLEDYFFGEKEVDLRKLHSLALQFAANQASLSKEALSTLEEGLAELRSSSEESQQHAMLTAALSKAHLPFFQEATNGNLLEYLYGEVVGVKRLATRFVQNQNLSLEELTALKKGLGPILQRQEGDGRYGKLAEDLLPVYSARQGEHGDSLTEALSEAKFTSFQSNRVSLESLLIEVRLRELYLLARQFIENPNNLSKEALRTLEDGLEQMVDCRPPTEESRQYAILSGALSRDNLPFFQSAKHVVRGFDRGKRLDLDYLYDAVVRKGMALDAKEHELNKPLLEVLPPKFSSFLRNQESKRLWSKRGDYIYFLDLLKRRDSFTSGADKWILISLWESMYRYQAMSSENYLPTLEGRRDWFEIYIKDELFKEYETFLDEHCEWFFNEKERSTQPTSDEPLISVSQGEETPTKGEGVKVSLSGQDWQEEGALATDGEIKNLPASLSATGVVGEFHFASGPTVCKGLRELKTAEFKELLFAKPDKHSFYVYYLQFLCKLCQEGKLDEELQEKLLQLLEEIYKTEKPSESITSNAGLLDAMRKAFEKLKLGKDVFGSVSEAKEGEGTKENVTRDSESVSEKNVGRKENPSLNSAKKLLYQTGKIEWSINNLLHLEYLLKNSDQLHQSDKYLLQTVGAQMYDTLRKALYDGSFNDPFNWFWPKYQDINLLYPTFLIKEYSSTKYNLVELKEEGRVKRGNLTPEERLQLLRFALSAEFLSAPDAVRRELVAAIQINVPDFREKVALEWTLVYGREPWQPVKWPSSTLGKLGAGFLAIFKLPANILRLIPFGFGVVSTKGFGAHDNWFSNFFKGVFRIPWAAGMLSFKPVDAWRLLKTYTKRPYLSAFGVLFGSVTLWGIILFSLGSGAGYDTLNMEKMLNFFNEHFSFLSNHFSEFASEFANLQFIADYTSLAASSVEAVLVLATLGAAVMVLQGAIMGIEHLVYKEPAQTPREQESSLTSTSSPRVEQTNTLETVSEMERKKGATHEATATKTTATTKDPNASSTSTTLPSAPPANTTTTTTTATTPLYSSPQMRAAPGTPTKKDLTGTAEKSSPQKKSPTPSTPTKPKRTTITPSASPIRMNLTGSRSPSRSPSGTKTRERDDGLSLENPVGSKGENPLEVGKGSMTL